MDVWQKELQVLSGYGSQVEQYEGESLHTYDLLWRLVQEGRINLEGLLTHTFTTDRFKEALRTVTRGPRQGVVKAAFRFDH